MMHPQLWAATLQAASSASPTVRATAMVLPSLVRLLAQAPAAQL